MKELTVFAEIETSKLLDGIPTAFEPGIWRYCLYATGELLPFMEDTFNRVSIKCNNLVIDQVEYLKLDSLNYLRSYVPTETTGAWYNEGSVIYVRFPFYNPPYLFFSKKYGTLMGFTDGSPKIINGTVYKSGLLSTPEITVSADAFTYDRMKFNSANISIDNSDGQFDDAGDFFGNEFNILVAVMPERKEDNRHLIRTIEETGNEKIASVDSGIDEYVTLYQEKKDEEIKLKLLVQYYIENISVTLDKADFKLNDKRERLSAMIPNKQYTREEYPFIDDNMIDKDMQEVYGKCFGVPGVCLQGEQINARDGEPKDSEGYLTEYKYRFSSKIARLDRIQVKMTAGEYPDSASEYKMKNTDGWTEIWNSKTGWKDGVGNDAGNVTNPTLLAQGIITLRWDIAKQGGLRENRINEVRADGVFIAFPENNNGILKATPKDIIKNIMYKYSNIPYDKNYFDMGKEGTGKGGFDDELSKLDPYEIGIMFDKSISIYEAIEQIQSGSVFGFQFQVHENKFTARLDDPDRKERGSISHTEILNLNEIEVDWNAELYGTYTDIEYAHRYEEDEFSRFIDRGSRQDILDIHRIDKVWNVQTLLANKDDAKKKSDKLLEDFKKLKPIIRNIKLSGEKWFGLVEDFEELRIYDIIKIDFSIHGEDVDKYPRHLIKLIEEVGEEKIISMVSGTEEYITLYNDDEKKSNGKRDFMSELSCQVLSINKDTKLGVITIDVRVK